MNEQLKVCTIQMACHVGEVAYNLNKAKELMKKAKEKGAELVLLPELFDVGYDLELIKTLDYDTHETLNVLKALCRQLDVYVIAGLYENTVEGQFNTAYVIDNHGYEVGKYRKNKLFCLSNEREVFTPGNTPFTFNINNMRIGIMICYDIRFPELSRKYIDAECDVLAVIAAFPFPRVEHWKTLLKARAIENQVYMLASNRIGRDKDLWFHGRSCIIDPWGMILGEANETEEGFVLATISLEEVQSIRKALPVLEDR